MLSIRRTILWSTLIAALAGAVAFAQPPRPASEATPFFKKYEPCRQLLAATMKERLASTGGGGGGIVPVDRKNCEGKFSATPEQADRVLRRLYMGVREVGKDAGATLDGPQELPRGKPAGAFRVRYAQGDCLGEVVVQPRRGDRAASRGAYQYTITIIIAEAKRSKQKS